MHTFSALALCFLPWAVLHAECRTTLDIPCHTIEQRHEQTTLFLRGLTDLSTASTESKFAVSANGSTYARSVVRNGFGFGGRMRPAHHIQVYDASLKRIFTLAPEGRTYVVRTPGEGHHQPFRLSKAGDATCATGIVHHGSDFQLIGSEPILGVRAIHWHRPLGNGGYEDRWLAPELDCVGLRHRMVMKNALHLPVLIDSSETTRLEIQQPDSGLFQLPANYREVAALGRFRVRGRP